MAKKRVSRRSSPSLPVRGDTFVMPLADGRLGACRVLRSAEAHEDNFTEPDSLLVAATPWIGTESPDLGEPLLRSILVLNHHNWDNSALLHWVSGPPPKTFRHLGNIPPSARQEEPSSFAFSSWESFPLQVLLQWRWDHDRAAVLAEDEQRARELELAQQQATAQANLRRATLTYAQLRKERPFQGWEGYVAPDILRAARRLFRDTIDALVALGPEPLEAAVLDVLRHCIERFNELDEEHDHFIGTIEREDICEHFDELVHVSGLEDYDDLVDRWRDW
jgi:hypothetical protein